MKKYKVTFVDEIEADTEDEAYTILLQYLSDCVHYEDVTAFDFTEVWDAKKINKLKKLS